MGGLSRGTYLLIALCALVSFVIGWSVRPEDAEGQPALTEFQAEVESVDPDGLRACLLAIDEVTAHRFGGPVCGRIFLARGTDAAPGQRVHVQWFAATSPETDEPVDAMVLSPRTP